MLNVKPIVAAVGMLCALTVALAACSKLDTPQLGHYRAAIELKGGEAPLHLQLARQKDQLQLSLLSGVEALNASEVRVQNGELRAIFPNGAGELQASFDRKGLSGHWLLADAHGKTASLPFTAQLGASFRFVEKSATDNADITGQWTLHQAGQEAPIMLSLKQSHDAVDGILSLPDGAPLTVQGQVHNNDVYLSAVGTGQVLLLKAKVNAQGALEGRLWRNLGEAKNWTAQLSGDQSTLDSAVDNSRRVAFPTAVPLP